MTAPGPSGWVQVPGADKVLVKPRVTGERFWNGGIVYKDLSLVVTQKRGPFMEDPAVQVPRILKDSAFLHVSTRDPLSLTSQL